MELKENMYVRTNDGYIAKYDNSKHNCDGKYYGFDSVIKDIRFVIDDDEEFLWESQLKTHIVKASYNIIDLIEVGDYVNGYKVVVIDVLNNRVDIGLGEDYYWLRNKDIKSIVTKEQFESMEYKVGDSNE